MVPKIIHYCWFGSKRLPLETKVLIKEWHNKMPDYVINCWSENNIDINSSLWLQQAIKHKKWAFAADYVRLFVLYHYGGIYMDTDVEVFKPFDEFLNYSLFSSIEIHEGFESEGKPLLNEDFLPKIKGETIPNLGILSALIACEPFNRYIGDCLYFYDNQSFIKEDGSMFTDIIIPDFLAREAIKYGFRYIDKTQKLDDNMIIFNSSVFAGDYKCQTENTYAIHFCYGTWRKKIFKNRMKWWYRHKKWALQKYFNMYIKNINHEQ